MPINRQRGSGFKNGQPMGGDRKPAKPRPKPAGPAPRGFRDEPFDARRDDRPPRGPRHDPRPMRPPPPPKPIIVEVPVLPPNPDELPLILYGRNPVREAIKSGRSIDRILVSAVSAEDGSLREIIRMAKEARIVVSEVTRAKLDELTLPYGYGGKPANHQGIIARVPDCQYVEIDDILNAAREKGEPPFVLLLDSINDPHNLGSIMRSALCAGVHGIIIPKRRSVSVTAAAAKASAGAVAYLPVAKVSNLSAAAERLKEEGLWICGADAAGQDMCSVDMRGPLALVIGGEDEGIARLLRDKCDYLAAIPMQGPLNSLNASVAAALLMYEKVRQDRG